MLTSLAHETAMTLLASSVPNPSPQAPPGSDGFLTVLNWVFWIALAAGVLGFMIVGVLMMLSNTGRMSSGGEHVSKLAWVAVGLIVVAAASGLTSTFS